MLKPVTIIRRWDWALQCPVLVLPGFPCERGKIAAYYGPGDIREITVNWYSRAKTTQTGYYEFSTQPVYMGKDTVQRRAIKQLEAALSEQYRIVRVMYHNSRQQRVKAWTLR